ACARERPVAPALQEGMLRMWLRTAQEIPAFSFDHLVAERDDQSPQRNRKPARSSVSWLTLTSPSRRPQVPMQQPQPPRHLPREIGEQFLAQRGVLAQQALESLAAEL